MSVWQLLLQCSIRPAFKSLRAAAWGENFRSALIALVFLVVLALFYEIFAPIVAYFWSLDEVGPVVIRALIYFLFMALSVLTFFSAVIAMSAQFFSGSDAELFLARPTPSPIYFRFRYWQAALSTSWMFLPFWLPIVLAIRHASGQSFLFVIWAILAPLPLGWAVSSLAAGLVIFVSQRLSVKRLKGGFSAALGLMAVGLIFLLRVIQPEKLTRPDSAVTLEAFLKTWTPASHPYDPIALLSDAVMHFNSDFLDALGCLAILWAAAILFYFFLLRSSEKQFLNLWLKSRDFLEGGAEKRRQASWLWSHLEGRWRLLFLKELSSLLRNPIMRLQVVLVLAINAMFFYSINKLPLQDDIGLKEMLFMPVCGLSQLILIAAATRFVFPLESVESSGSWIFRSAPLRRKDWLLSRLWIYAPPLFILNILLFGSCVHAFDPDLRKFLIALPLMLASPLGIAALTAYLGIAWKRSDVTHPEEMTTSPAGILTMILGLIYVFAQIGVLQLPLHEMNRHYMEMTTPWHWGPLLAGALLWLMLQSAAIALPWRMAWRRMEQGA